MQPGYSVCISLIFAFLQLNAIAGNKDCGSVNLQSFYNVAEFAAPGEYPWMARVGFNATGEIRFEALAVLISKRYLLGAGFNAYHMRQPAQQVQFGDSSSSAKGQVPSVFELEAVIMHPDFDEVKRTNDIAMLQLRQYMVFDEYISPICLPPPGVYMEDYFAGQFLPYVGYSYKNGLVENKVKTLLHVMSTINCQQTLAQSEFVFDEKEICGIPQSQILMKTGSALMGVRLQRGIPKNFYLIALVTHGSTRPRSNLPDVFTRVSGYLEWIEQVQWEESFIDVRRNH